MQLLLLSDTLYASSVEFRPHLSIYKLNLFVLRTKETDHTERLRPGPDELAFNSQSIHCKSLN